MQYLKHLTLFMALTILFPGMELLIAQDNYGWQGIDRNGTVQGFESPEKWPVKLNKKWQIKIGTGDASPVFSGDRIYAFANKEEKEVVYCLDAKSGKEVWMTALNKAPEITGPSASHPGPRSTPFVSDNKLFTLGAAGSFCCLNTKNGRVFWRNDSYKEVPPFYTSCSPLVINNLCIVQLGGNENGVLVAFNKDTGEEVWKVPGIPCTYSSPVFMQSTGILLVQSASHLLGISLDGELLWEIPTPALRRHYNVPTHVYHKNLVIVTGQGEGTKAYSISKEGSAWKTEEIWSNSELGTSFNTPLLMDGLLYAHEARLGKLFCLDLNTGKKVWMNVTTLNRFASLQYLENAIASMPANGKLIFFKPGGDSFEQLAEYEVSATDVYAHPLFIGNKVIIKDQEMLTCWQIK